MAGIFCQKLFIYSINECIDNIVGRFNHSNFINGEPVEMRGGLGRETQMGWYRIEWLGLECVMDEIGT